MNAYKHILILLIASVLCGLCSAQEAKLRVVVSTPDVASLAEEIGGDLVQVYCFTKGPEDPHIIEILPSHVRELQKADLYIQVGLGIENAWLKALMQRVKNPEFRSGGSQNLNLGRNVTLLEGEEGGAIADSFHEEGNPHYLLDPVEGLKASRAICHKFVELRPDAESAFEKRHAAFCKNWAEAFFGNAIATPSDLDALEDFESSEALEAAIEEVINRAGDKVGGIVGMMRKHSGAKIVGDHDLWPYFARRYDLEILGYLEPSPGVPPTTKHLAKMIGLMKENEVTVVLTAPYFPIRHAQLVSKRTGATVVPMTHQTAGRTGAETFLTMIEYNAVQISGALKSASQ